MQNLIKCSIAAAVLALGATQASALQLINWHNVHLNEGQSANGGFDIAPPYNPATETILSATLTFYFMDDSYSDVQEYAVVHVDGSWFGSTPVGNQLANLPLSFFNIFGSVSGSVAAQLSGDGELSYTVSNQSDNNRFTQRDFIFKKAVLDVDIGQRANVPDGGVTVALLGLGVCGLALLRRKY